MKILCILHADFEGPGVIQTWAAQNDFPFEIIRPYRGESLNGKNADVLIVMGGPQSAVSMMDTPYLNDEVKFIKSHLALQKPALGVCLGAQLLGIALGASADRSPEKEVGVYPITLTFEAKIDPLLKDEPQNFPVIHWHNDMPGLTPEAVVLAQSAGCPRQIIRFAPRVYGFQCHLEIDLLGIEKMIESCPEDFKPSRFTQHKSEFRIQDFKSINQRMIVILDRFKTLLES